MGLSLFFRYVFLTPAFWCRIFSFSRRKFLAASKKVKFFAPEVGG